MFDQAVFENSQRLNIKVFSKKDFESDRDEVKKLNKDFYDKLNQGQEEITDVRSFQMSHELHARLWK